MHLFLVRHGEASQYETAAPSQSLTPSGTRATEKMAAHLASINIHVDLIVHSTKARAKQTAVILARQLNPIKGISEGEDLGPNADPMIWTKRLAGLNENVMMVGHMPYMSRMASLLACGFSDESAFIFGNSAVICLERFYEAWSINWMITPQVICDDTQA